MIAALLPLGYQEIWYLVPLLVVVSLVYAATRHEHLRPILVHAVRFGLWIIGFMAIVMVILLVMDHFA